MRTPRQIIGDDKYEQLIFEGYAVVPVEPSPEMIEAGGRGPNMNYVWLTGESVIGRWKAMIDAALTK
jgi:hypothetical protein